MGIPQQINTCENITFPQLCWWVVKMTKTTSYPESRSTKMFTGTIEMLQRGHILKVNCCLKVQNAHVNSESDVLPSTNLPYTNLTVLNVLLVGNSLPSSVSTFPCTTGITRWYPWGYSGSLHTPVRHTEVLREKFQFGWGVFLIRSEMDRCVGVETGCGYSVLVRTESSMITSSSDSVLVCVSQIRSSYWGGGVFYTEYLLFCEILTTFPLPLGQTLHHM